MASAEARLVEVGHKLAEVTSKIRELERERRKLEKEQARLTDELQKEECDKLLAQDWGRTTFEWSERVNLAKKEVFGLDKFRENQLEVINATLSKHDCLLVMPTGGGKSLTYQLPAVISDGVTLVVSPLLSLMEDQLMGLRKRGVGAEMLTGTTDKETKARVMKEMLDKNSQLRLLYVTPEKCSKSKQFMAKLQKMHQAGRFVRLAIDEVHCCSQWGHDFRPDYKFLGAMRELFPDVPILGLTATSTAGVTKDVKEILRIPQALLFMSDFNRPNLRYSVELKPEGAEEQMGLLERLVGKEFKGQTGIIYTTTVKEVETIAGELRKRGLRVGAYHAQMEPPEARSKVHRAWAEGRLQAVVATLAFGMGIDKPDVRFVIHNTVSRSMENFYQESGRAGRDGKEARCIMLFRLGDMFKQSTMVFTEQTGLQKLYSMVAYCLDRSTCRREMIAQHFLDTWETIPCDGMCDNCTREDEAAKGEVGDAARAAVGILEQAARREQRVTGLKLVEAVQGRGANNLKLAGWTGDGLSKDQVESLVAHLTVEGHLKEDFHFTPYSTISYLVQGHRPVRGDLVIPFFTGRTFVKRTGSTKRKDIDSSEDGKESKAAKVKASVSSKGANVKSEKSSQNLVSNFDIGDIVISSDEDFM